MERVAIFPGSFDPFTKGHEDLVRRGAKIFDELIIGIGVNSNKKRFFEADFMIEKIQECLSDLPNVKVIAYEGLTAHIAKKCNAQFILRGLRNTTDFEYENTISQANKYINDDLETVFLITEPELAHISSTITREIYKFGGDVSAFLPYSLK
jgi:pantetheine-phosphate adenylyltransferase